MSSPGMIPPRPSRPSCGRHHSIISDTRSSLRHAANSGSPLPLDPGPTNRPSGDLPKRDGRKTRACDDLADPLGRPRFLSHGVGLTARAATSPPNHLPFCAGLPCGALPADDHHGDCSGTKFYHWGALTGMITLIEEGYY